MKNNLNFKFDFKTIRVRSKKYLRLISAHITFGIVLVVLLAYLFVVWRISGLATAESAPDTATSPTTTIPKIDPKAIAQIQSLEQSNTEIHSLFNDARKNPFQE
jgi:uncharacterized iron-regulated membrane protein